MTLLMLFAGVAGSVFAIVRAKPGQIRRFVTIFVVACWVGSMSYVELKPVVQRTRPDLVTLFELFYSAVMFSGIAFTIKRLTAISDHNDDLHSAP